MLPHSMGSSSQGLRYQAGTAFVPNLMRFVMNMSEMANKLKYDIADTLKRVTGKLSSRKDSHGERSSSASNGSSMKK